MLSNGLHCLQEDANWKARCQHLSVGFPGQAGPWVRRLRPFCFPTKLANNASVASATVSNYSDNILESVRENLCFPFSFLTRNVHGRTRSSTSAERRHSLSIHIQGWHCVIWSQALIFQGLSLLLCKWRSWLNSSMPGPHFRPHLLKETFPAQPI